MNTAQRIAFLCHPYHRGGVTRWMADAAVAFAGMGLEVYFLTVDPAREFFSAKGRETLLQLLGNGRQQIKIITGTAGYEFEFGTAGYRAAIYKKLLARLPAETPVILSDDYAVWEAATSVHEHYPVIGVLHADEDHYYELAKRYYKCADMLVCVSERIHNRVTQRVPGFHPDRIFTISCGINLPEISYSDYHGDVTQLVYVGRINNYQKRAADLAKICISLSGSPIKYHLTIIGEGDARPAIETAVAEAGVNEHVTFCGWLSQRDVLQYLSDSDILLLTSDFEGMPIAMMEAMAMGCGVAGTRVSGIEDYEFHPLAKDCLKVYQPGDINDAVRKIISIAAIPKMTRQAAARRLAQEEFSMRACLEKYLEVISAIKPPANLQAVNTRMPASMVLYSRAVALLRRLKIAIAGGK